MSDHADPKQPPDEDEPSLSEQIGESIRSEDEPMGDEKPAAPLALVMGSYPIILIVLLLMLAAYFFWFRTSPEADREDEPARPAEVDPMDAPATAPITDPAA